MNTNWAPKCVTSLDKSRGTLSCRKEEVVRWFFSPNLVHTLGTISADNSTKECSMILAFCHMKLSLNNIWTETNCIQEISPGAASKLAVEAVTDNIWGGLVWFIFINVLSTPYKLFNAETWFLCKCLIIIIIIFAIYYCIFKLHSVCLKSFLQTFIWYKDCTDNKFTTSPYKKPSSDNSTLLNYQSECLQKYEIAIIKNLIHREFYISSSKTIFYKELTNIKQALVNNNVTNKLVNQQIELYLHNIHKIITQPTITTQAELSIL